MGFGSNFSISGNPNDILEFLINFDNFTRRFSDNIGDSSCLKGFILHDILNNIQKGCNLPKILIDSIHKLKYNKDIIITRSDKGNKTVIMNKEDYILKCSNLLNDRTTYAKLNKNPLKDSQKYYNSSLKNILKEFPELIK